MSVGELDFHLVDMSIFLFLLSFPMFLRLNCIPMTGRLSLSATSNWFPGNNSSSLSVVVAVACSKQVVHISMSIPYVHACSQP